LATPSHVEEAILPTGASQRTHCDTRGIVIGAATFVVRTADLPSRVPAAAVVVGPGVRTPDRDRAVTAIKAAARDGFASLAE